MLEPVLARRFWQKVLPASTDGCWLWAAGKTKQGYGVFRVGTVLWRSHRLAYVEAHGAIPDGLELDHLCRNRSCVNPEHLEPVTHRENILRGDAPPAINSRKDYCKRGHPLTPENLKVSQLPFGRQCRHCVNDLQRERYHARKKAPND